MLAGAIADGFAFSDYATEVVAMQGDFSGSRYREPSAVLGKPALQCRNDTAWDPQLDSTFRVKIVEAAYHYDLAGGKVVTTINPGESITVKFDHPVVDFPSNPYGQDLIVFGNAFFQYSSQQRISDAANLNSTLLGNPAQYASGGVVVSVSQDGIVWHRFEYGPWGDDLFPTQAYGWDRANACWTDEEMDFTKPVDPNLSLWEFNGLTVADAIDLYDGSGGGTSFDLKDLPDYDVLIADPNTGWRWIQYVRLEGGEGMFAEGGQVDAVSDVAVCGDLTHPYPAGDITKDCRVDLWDLAVLAGSWLQCTYRCE